MRVRMGVHSGEPVRHDDSYIGVDVHRAAEHLSQQEALALVLSPSPGQPRELKR